MMFVISICIGQAKWVYYRTKSRSLMELELIEEASRGPWYVLKSSTYASLLASITSVVYHQCRVEIQ